MKILADGRQMRAMDLRTIEQMGIPSCVLMERAALAVAGYIRDDPRLCHSGILVVCGSGNNGGDGAAIARILFLWGWKVALYPAGDMEKATEEMKAQMKTARAYQVPGLDQEPDLKAYQVIVDALFGVGLKRPVTGAYAGLLRRLNKADAFRIAVDLPSGVNADNGQVPGEAFRADVTITLGCLKRGLFLYPGKSFAGKVVPADIGIYPDGETYDCFLTEKDDLAEYMKRRPDGNKGTFGRVLTVAGSRSMAGAAYLSAHAALCSGAGMVKVQTPPENRLPLMSLLPEAMTECSMPGDDPDETVIKWTECIRWCDSLIIGPGLGTDTEAAERAEWFLREGNVLGKKIILDADALNLLSSHPEWKACLNANVILTPHMGEMSRLTGVPVEKLASDRIHYARELAEEYGCTCVMKDACTVTASPEGTCWISPAGNSGMATAGSGDVLAGILGGLAARISRRQDSEDAEYDSGRMAACGVLLHGLAGDKAAEEEGRNAMTARSLITWMKKIRIE